MRQCLRTCRRPMGALPAYECAAGVRKRRRFTRVLPAYKNAADLRELHGPMRALPAYQTAADLCRPAVLACKRTQVTRDGFQRRLPLTELRLPVQRGARIPRTVAAVEQPDPVRIDVKQHPVRWPIAPLRCAADVQTVMTRSSAPTNAAVSSKVANSAVWSVIGKPAARAAATSAPAPGCNE